jgi:hypothetical protein
MPSITGQQAAAAGTRRFIHALKAAHLTDIAFILTTRGDGHGLNAGATITANPERIRIGIEHDLDGQLRAFYGTSPTDTLPIVDHDLQSRLREALDKLEKLRQEAEDLYRSRMQETGVRLAAEFTERLMAARAAGDVSFDVLAELPRDQLAQAGLQTVSDLNALAERHS